ncbi:MAG: hypothetical protein A3F43_05115 [Gammaproteobacteria bacterium RIFCSPHIGHO2_12_FULL_42_10]|nr:MAG: hypothetical protein A3F43_05115 [Gammaproteobacteria bacterium RIFCSPHIGHO2_12_FULL_42_10]
MLACVLAFIVILLGAYTRLTNAGLSCPDWPHCYGYLVAPHTKAQLETAFNRYPATPVNIKKAWTEMTHRYLAGTEGILVLALVISIWGNRKKDSLSRMMSFVLMTLLCAQVLLGMLTVTEKLHPIIVLLHLLIGLSILSILWRLFLCMLSRPLIHRKTRSLWLWIGLILIGLQITLGGFVSTHSAGLACIDFPYCNGQLIPALNWHALNSDLITIHMLHRLGALVVAVYFGILAILLWQSPTERRIGTFIFILIALQITLGITNILWLRPVPIALLHLATAIGLLLITITVLSSPQKAPSSPLSQK